VAPRTQRSDGALTRRSATPANRVSNPPARREANAGNRASTYRVREGDTLWEVARRNGVSVNALARANRRSTRGVLKVGTVLRIPAE
jgi:membrane-bound lytic murein transglycosylase D